MKSIFPKVVILGATGMLGRTMYLYLSKKHSNVYRTSRKRKSGFIFLDALSTIKKLNKTFEQLKPEFVINCIGILKDGNTKYLKSINSDFPKKISLVSKSSSFKIINTSTDAVFGNLQEEVNEDSIPMPDGEYEKSKMAGEQKLNTLNIRTSLIGFDPNRHKGLLEYLMKKRNNSPIGFVNQKWSGATTLQLAKFIEYLIYSGKFTNIFKTTNVVHFTPIKSSNKYEIIKTFAGLLKLRTPKKGFDKKINRILKSKYISERELKRYGNSLNKALKELINFDQNYVKNYKKN